MKEIDVSGWVNQPQKPKKSRKEILALRKKRRRQRILARVIVITLVLLCCVLCFLLMRYIFRLVRNDNLPVFGVKTENVTAEEPVHRSQRLSALENDAERPEMVQDFLTENPYSRPGEPLETVKNIFIHYTANPGTTAAQNRNYFEGLGQTGETSASAHFIIGLEGEIIQCLPLDEIGYAVKTRNYDSISIECCYDSEDGSFSEETYRSLVELTVWLLKGLELEEEDVLRHYDAGGKLCPLYYVENENAWQTFLADLREYNANLK